MRETQRDEYLTSMMNQFHKVMQQASNRYKCEETASGILVAKREIVAGGEFASNAYKKR